MCRILQRTGTTAAIDNLFCAVSGRRVNPVASAWFVAGLGALTGYGLAFQKSMVRVVDERSHFGSPSPQCLRTAPRLVLHAVLETNARLMRLLVSTHPRSAWRHLVLAFLCAARSQSLLWRKLLAACTRTRVAATGAAPSCGHDSLSIGLQLIPATVSNWNETTLWSS
jgi:hypothetical protein